MLGLSYPGNISDLIFRGFLTLTVSVGDHQLVLKSINENESADIERLSGVSDDEIREATGEEQVFLAGRRVPWLLAYSTFLIDDHCVLSDRGKSGWYRPLVDFYKTRHPKMLGPLVSATTRLSSWYSYEAANIERYSMEPLTRGMWASYKGVLLNSPAVTCQEGTQYLGLNQHQILLKSFLSQWERKKEFEQQWELSKAVIAAHNSKMYQNIERSDKTRRATEEQHEQEVIEGRVVSANRDDIYEEMERELVQQVTGEKDDFDLQIMERELREKWDMLLDRLDTVMYTLMYGRKLRHKDMVVIGKTVRDELPMGEFDMDEARAIFRRSITDLNDYGKFLTEMEAPTEDEEEVVIGVAAIVATSWYEDFQNEEKIQDDSATNITIS